MNRRGLLEARSPKKTVGKCRSPWKTFFSSLLLNQTSYLIIPTLAIAQSPGQREVHGVDLGIERPSTAISVGTYRLRLVDASIYGPTTGAMVTLPVTDKISTSLSVDVGHGDIRGSSTAFMTWGIDMEFSPFSRRHGAQYSVNSDGISILKAVRPSGGGLLLSGGLRQFYFNASDRTLPFSGGSFSLGWEQEILGGYFRVRPYLAADLVRNGDVNLQVMRFGINVKWLMGE